MDANSPPEFEHSDDLRNYMIVVYMKLNDSEEEVMHALQEANSELTPTEISEKVDYSDSTVYRALDGLEDTIPEDIVETEDGYELDAFFKNVLSDFREYREALDQWESNLE